MSHFTLDIQIMDDLSLKVYIFKKNNYSQQTKNGLAGWILFRRAKYNDYPHITNGNIITSLIANEWKLLSKHEKLRWKETAENPLVCGNRWVNYLEIL